MRLHEDNISGRNRIKIKLEGNDLNITYVHTYHLYRETKREIIADLKNTSNSNRTRLGIPHPSHTMVPHTHAPRCRCTPLKGCFQPPHAPWKVS